MIKLNPMDGEAEVYLHRDVDLLQLLKDSEDSAIVMGYTHDLRCFCNYMIAHYDGYFDGLHTKYHVIYPLSRL